MKKYNNGEKKNKCGFEIYKFSTHFSMFNLSAQNIDDLSIFDLIFDLFILIFGTPPPLPEHF